MDVVVPVDMVTEAMDKDDLGDDGNSWLTSESEHDIIQRYQNRHAITYCPGLGVEALTTSLKRAFSLGSHDVAVVQVISNVW